MKKILLTLFVTCFSLIVFADSCPYDIQCECQPCECQTCVCHKSKTSDKWAAQPQATKDEKWSFIQIGFWFDIPSSTAKSNVYGLKTGWPISSGSGFVNGAEISWLAAATDNLNGLQACWIYTQNKYLTGAQGSFICNINKKGLRGLQAGLVNVSGNLTGFQPGGVNVSKDIDGIQASALTNVAQGTVTGAQFSLVNVINNTLNGFQASAFNTAEKSNGFQLGLINLSNSGGAQFGVANYIKDGWIPFMPFFNIKW